jgi:hypothetical protein
MGVACECCVLSGSGGAGLLGTVAPWGKKMYGWNIIQFKVTVPCFFLL